MPPPPIPSRKEEGNDEASVPPPIPVRSPRRPPPGAVATVMVSGQGRLPSMSDVADNQQADAAEDGTHATDPYDLKTLPGSIVTASYPFHGSDDLQQLSFAVGDQIKVKQKEEMWSWGVLERDGKEGWFPHNYVGTTFKPLPGIHEMAAKIRERREKLDAAQDRQDAAASRQQSAAGVHPASDGNPTGEANTAPEGETVPGGATLDEEQSPPELAPGIRESAGDTTGPVNVAAAQHEEASGVGDTTAPENSQSIPQAPAPAATSSKSAKRDSQASAAAPSLPPFFKDAPASKSSATAVLRPTSDAPDEVNSTEVVDNSQISGVGFAGKSNVSTTGCKCVVM